MGELASIVPPFPSAEMMNRIRRPFPISRRDTDSVQLNTLEPHTTPEDSDKKGAEVGIEADSPDLEHGHLQEIEVDVDKVLHDGEVKDIDADTSPYPEGMMTDIHGRCL